MGAIITSGVIGAAAQTTQLSVIAGASSNFQQTASASTVGNRFYTSSNRTILGVQFRWIRAAGGTETVKVALWNSAGSLVEAVSSSVSSDGLKTIYFTTPHTINAYTRFTITHRRTDSNGYCYFTSGGLSVVPPGIKLNVGGGYSYWLGPYLYCEGSYYNVSADAYPGTAIAFDTQAFAIDPILDVS